MDVIRGMLAGSAVAGSVQRGEGLTGCEADRCSQSNGGL